MVRFLIRSAVERKPSDGPWTYLSPKTLVEQGRPRRRSVNGPFLYVTESPRVSSSHSVEFVDHPCQVLRISGKSQKTGLPRTCNQRRFCRSQSRLKFATRQSDEADNGRFSSRLALAQPSR